MTAIAHSSATILPWQGAAEQLRQVLAQLPAPERRRILDFISMPPEPPKRQQYSATACLRAKQRVAELLQLHTKWTQAKARRETARELGVSTVVLRRMLATPV
ncbi:hypothetical protein DNI29_19090 [Hymenobacter sediminis]|uniref:hypothetical protein n=1 Tax=Hymenobacter sediminis TaxID=2218621 RepID=UPI000DA68610|nr:hypothetical protein [Hymenobacter sediminis]RPD45488.1 hypothetical protein DNI29_19090 [Hymenobacter sediminis]